jgi:MFS family permease
MILQGLAPSIWGAVADVHGRRVTYICTFIILIGACVGLAEIEHYYQLVILRCLQSRYFPQNLVTLSIVSRGLSLLLTCLHSQRI